MAPRTGLTAATTYGRCGSSAVSSFLRQRIRKGWGCLKTDGANTPTWEKAVVTVTQYHHGTPLDYEGLCSGMGPAIDAFVDMGVIKDDGPKYLLDYRMRHVKVATKAERRVEVTMAEAQLEEGDTIRSTVWKKPRKRPPLVLAEDDWDKPAEEQSGRPAHMTEIPEGA